MLILRWVCLSQPGFYISLSSMFKAGSERLVKRLLAPPVGSFWLSLRSPPSICILCEKGGHWLTRFSKFVLFSCPFLDLCLQFFSLQTIHAVNITPTELPSPVVSWCCCRMQSPNDVIQKIEKSLKNTHTTTRRQWFPQHLVIFCSELVF